MGCVPLLVHAPNHLRQEPRDPMVDYINRLPDEVICYILSFLTVRDAVIARLSSRRWLRLPDFRSVLQFDRPNVLDKKNLWKMGPAYQSMFVRTVNRFLELWMGNRISKLLVRFSLANDHAPHIDRWIATSFAMEVEEIELDFIAIEKEKYVFPCHLLCFGKEPYMKRLSLEGCTMSLSSQCRSWLSNLTTLSLTRIPLHENGWQLILSAGSNLISLVFITCSLPATLSIDGQLLCLKKFIIHDNHVRKIKLNCPNLEAFKYYGGTCTLYFAHVPTLRKASVLFVYDSGLCSKLFSHLTRNAPQLQDLSLWIATEVRPFRATPARCCLRRLNLMIRRSAGFDLLSITYLLNASPFLETLELTLDYFKPVRLIQGGEYPDHPHFQLKQVKILQFQDQCNEMELAIYLVRNAVALQQMVIDGWREVKQKDRILLLENKINPNAEVIFPVTSPI